jgi:hypothetical protein
MVWYHTIIFYAIQATYKKRSLSCKCFRFFCHYFCHHHNDNALIFRTSFSLNICILIIPWLHRSNGWFLHYLRGVNANSDYRGYFAAVFMTRSLEILMHCEHEFTSTRECDVFVCVYCDMTRLLWPVWIRNYKNLRLVKVVIKRKIISTTVKPAL